MVCSLPISRLSKDQIQNWKSLQDSPHHWYPFHYHLFIGMYLSFHPFESTWLGTLWGCVHTKCWSWRQDTLYPSVHPFLVESAEEYERFHMELNHLQKRGDSPNIKIPNKAYSMWYIDFRRKDIRMRSMTRNMEIPRHSRNDDGSLESTTILTCCHVQLRQLYPITMMNQNHLILYIWSFEDIL